MNNPALNVQPGTLNPRITPTTPFDLVAIDHVGLINPDNDNKYIITAEDLKNWFIVTRAMPDKYTADALQLIEEDIVKTGNLENFLHGMPVDYDITMLAEMWYVNAIEIFNWPLHKYFPLNRLQGSGGGVSLVVKNTMDYTQ